MPLLPPSSEALIKHKSVSPATMCQGCGVGKCQRIQLSALCSVPDTLQSPWPFPGGPSLPAPPTGTRGSYNLALMKLPSTLQPPHQLYPLMPILPTPAPVLPYNPGEKGGEALPYTYIELPQRPQCPLLHRAQTLEAETRNGPGHRTLSHHTGWEPTPNLFGVLCPILLQFCPWTGCL